MATLLERSKGKVFERDSIGLLGKPIQLESLVHMGTELIHFNSQEKDAKRMAGELALGLAKEYGCDYVLLGNNNITLNRALRDVPNYIYIATLYDKRIKYLN